MNYAHRRRIAAVENGRAVAPLSAAERVVVLAVEDNGPGIAPDTLEEIFRSVLHYQGAWKGDGVGSCAFGPAG